MRVLGLDLGERRVGVAVSDATGTLASPLTTLERAPDLHRRVARLVEDEEAVAVVVGLPLSMDGRERDAAGRARAEAEALAAALDVPVHLHDERLTTVAAHGRMAAAGRRSRARRGTVDSAAAAVLLQSWLDRRRP